VQFNRIPPCLTLFIFIILSFVAQPIAYTQIQPVKRNLTIDDFLKLKKIRSPQISPDGEWVVYTVSETNLKKDKRETRIWMIPTAGGESIPMTAEGSSASSPRWSPDGKYLSFLSDRNKKKTQVWILNRKGGEAQQLTEIIQGVSAYEWSPDGSKILLTIRDPKPEDLIKDEKEKKKPKPWIIDRLQFKEDEIGYLDRYRKHLYVFDVKSKNITQITSGDYDDSDGTWSPDGKLVAFVSNRTEEPDGNENSDIWIVSADNSDKGKKMLQVTKNPGADSEPYWSPDGDQLCYVTVTEPEIIWYATMHLAVISSDGGTPRVLTQSLDRMVYNPRFSNDGNSILFLIEDNGEQQLVRIDPSGGELIRLISGPRSIGDFHFEGDSKIVVLNSEPHFPPEVFTYSNETLSQLSHANSELLDSLNLAKVENIHFPSKDGTEIEGFMFLPPDYNDKLTYPTLLLPHGGPVSQYDFSFDFEAQFLAANGYVGLLPNPRGSSGYGQEFSMEIWQAWGVKDYEDAIASVDYAIAKGYSDPDRLGVGGWSYGGILTNYVIIQTDRFKAAISGSSEVLYVSNYGHDQWQYQWVKELGLPWDNKKLWDKLSPFNYVQNIKTPTLILCGEKDWTDPVLNSEQLYQALRRLGIETQLVVYPGESHGIDRPSFQKDRYQRYLDWYDKYLKGETSEKSK